ncbi:preprotein translocase subunit SecA [Enterobacteriaceae bacterium ET-AT1-13]|nr:preprotein translocase subunit SecA [Enterobacteriaceae bacterium ET-AT1-13]WGS66357.1 preprotein translocase subunit SecA [Enterobacteriaceae bacterium Cmel17]WMC17382.1 MAG: preprotein translocase subunit SecA [Enterobacteriaceae bacterium Cmel21]WMC17588.1 MAG: preprotein translocase subunit SecA [Enterobacteriaceae bacterium PSmelAO3-2]WMC17793.1 MAG: preprotein translocase subunit SecA [Enterobacteriaceae bacterium PSmelAO3-1]WMC17996.1 MAG: preprotein translocase subunit SecA [Enterob
MIYKLIKKIFNNKNYEFKNIYKIVKKINDLEPYIKKLSNIKIKKYTKKFKNRLKKGETLYNILPEAFSVVRETSKRVFGMRHFNVQLLGGIVLNNRCIAEMKTGEGKTLTSTLSIYLNALEGIGVHVITVNDYLAKRDAENNKYIFEFLGLKVGINLPEMSIIEKKKSYLADITYGTNNEFGFDYLRDNMIFNKELKVQRLLNYALIDEVDSILIDESRTPLIISSSSKNISNIYFKINKIISILVKQKTKNLNENKNFYIDFKNKQIYLSEKGLILIEKIFIKNNLIKKKKLLYSSENIYLIHHINNALRAHILFKRDVDYILKNKKIVIVDEHTGRIMNNRRWSDGLHQAIEAKENVPINNENQILSTITLQKYFLLYKKISGMTGTAYSEFNEFKEIYNLKTIIIPSNCKNIRKDFSDRIYISEKEKFKAIIKEIKKYNLKGQPLLIGTISIEKSEILSKKLSKLNISHKVLNAKFHLIESKIISKAGEIGSITIATNMAGRGTDIILGGKFNIKNNILNNQENRKLWKKKHDIISNIGGLHIIGSERHESRRIDNQLIGRSGRQGDPGSTRFYLSLEDTIIQMFTLYNISKIIYKFGFKSNEVIENNFITKLIKNAQKKIEIRNFEIRKQLIKYDNIINNIRDIFYIQRNNILNSFKVKKIICNIRKYVIKSIINQNVNKFFLITKINYINLENFFKNEFCLNFYIFKLFNNNKIAIKVLFKYILIIFKISYFKKEKFIGFKNIRNIEKYIMLKTLDLLWKEYLYFIDRLRKSIYFCIYIQKNPEQEYKRESFNIFCNMMEIFKYEIIYIITTIFFKI